ncbi:energy transducer TonB [Ekhidna sp.]
MEVKKNKKYDLEAKKPLFFGIGMIISLSLTLVAFEWKSPIDPIVDFIPIENDTYDEILIPPTVHTPPPPPPQSIPIIKSTNEESKEEPDIIIDIDILDEDPIVILIPTEVPDEKPDEVIRSYAEVMPSFEGGIQKFYSFISDRMKYPRAASKLGIEGKVFVQFIVGKDGLLSDIHVVKGIGSGCDEEALRVMNLVPKFIPAKQGDVRVPIKMIVPITFKLQ